MILTVMNAIYAIAYVEAWKIQDFNGIWTRDLTDYTQIQARRLSRNVAKDTL